MRGVGELSRRVYERFERRLFKSERAILGQMTIIISFVSVCRLLLAPTQIPPFVSSVGGRSRDRRRRDLRTRGRADDEATCDFTSLSSIHLLNEFLL